MIQIPRLYEAHRASGAIGSFHDMLDRIFTPLFDVTLDPSVDPPLHQFLALVVGFDTVDDESLPEAHRDSGSLPAPAQWTDATAPPYHMCACAPRAWLRLGVRLRRACPIVVLRSERPQTHTHTHTHSHTHSTHTHTHTHTTHTRTRVHQNTP